MIVPTDKKHKEHTSSRDRLVMGISLAVEVNEFPQELSRIQGRKKPFWQGWIHCVKKMFRIQITLFNSEGELNADRLSVISALLPGGQISVCLSKDDGERRVLSWAAVKKTEKRLECWEMLGALEALGKEQGNVQKVN